MKKSSNQLKEQANSIRLSASERNDLQARLHTYMEYHPLPEQVKTSRTLAPRAGRETAAEPFRMLNVLSWKMQRFVVVGAVLMMVGVPVLAERSLPGDMLYPMKVQVNEEVRSYFAFSPYAKVEWEADRLERRLSEARVLAEEGRLTEDVEQEFAQAVTRHSNTAKLAIESMREGGNDDAAIAEFSFVSVLEAQNDILALQTAMDSEQDPEDEVATTMALEAPTASSASESVQVERGSTLAIALRAAQENIDSAVPGRVTPEKLLALIERETTYAEELFASIESDASVKETQDIERRLSDVRRTVQRVQSQVELVHTAEANSNATSSDEVQEDTARTVERVVGELRKALIDTRKLISFMTDIGVRNSVSVERLVPIDLTDEERREQVETILETVSDLRPQVESVELSGGTLEKVTHGLGQVDLSVETALAALENGELIIAESAALEAENLIRDLLRIAQDSYEEPDSPTSASGSPAVSSQPTTTVATSSAATTSEVAEDE